MEVIESSIESILFEPIMYDLSEFSFRKTLSSTAPNIKYKSSIRRLMSIFGIIDKTSIIIYQIQSVMINKVQNID